MMNSWGGGRSDSLAVDSSNSQGVGMMEVHL